MSSVPMWSRPAVKETGPRRSSSSFKKPQRVSGKAGTRTRVSWDLALRQVSQVTQPTPLYTWAAEETSLKDEGRGRSATDAGVLESEQHRQGERRGAREKQRRRQAGEVYF